jgi:hypothetical protein
MPKYRIYVPVIAEDVYEVECESEDAARKMWEDGIDMEHFVHTTEGEEMEENNVYNTPEISIEEWN